MRKITLHILAILILLCTVCQPIQVSAAEMVDVTQECSLELDYSSNGTGFPGLEIQLYRIAEMYEDGAYALIAPFDKLPVRIHGITSQKEWQDAANTLASYITAQQIQPTKTKLTDRTGKTSFQDLSTGIYLVQGVTAERDNSIYKFENFCVFLPRPLTDGTYGYDLSAKPKSSVTPKPENPEETRYQVVKLWKDTGMRNQRPKSVTVSILKNGMVQETVLLNADNNWTYSWSAPVENDIWTVVEKDIPDAYTVVIREAGNVFTITNFRAAPEGQPPKTGDTFALRQWLTAMSLSGMMLIAIGILQKRKRS